MVILFLVISCLLMLTNHCFEASPPNLEYAHPFMTADTFSAAEFAYPFMTADAKKAAARTYDYIIVGGGTAGCPLAATLSQHHSVLVLERGGSPYGNPYIEDTVGVYKLSGETNNPVAQKFLSEDGVELIRARVLGGGTAINAGFYSRASMEYIRSMDWDEKLVNQSYEWVEKQIAFKPDRLLLWNSAVRDALLQIGVLPYNGYTLDHVDGTKISASIFDNNGKRHSAADLLKNANPDNIVVLLHANVDRILFNLTSGKVKANGVEFTSVVDGLSYQVLINELSCSSEVILSAGSIGSPQLLLLSGIGASQHLKEFNIPVLIDLPLVGKGIQDHTRVTIIFESLKPLEFSNIQVVGIADNSQLYIESGSFVLHDNGTYFQYFGSIATKVAFPLSRGELHLNSKDSQANPSVRYNYFSHPFDLQKCMLSVRVMANISETSSIQEFAFTDGDNSTMLRFLALRFPQNKSDDEGMAKFCRDTLNTMWHMHGGCHIDYVIDKSYRVKGVDNLRVVDNSIFKDSPGTNPQATTMMIGRYMGLQILQEHMNQ